MAITDTAQKNHEELFLNHQSTLKLTDPELVEVFDNFAFDEVLRHGDVDTKTRLVTLLASLIAQQTLADLRNGRNAQIPVIRKNRGERANRQSRPSATLGAALIGPIAGFMTDANPSLGLKSCGSHVCKLC